MTVSKAGQQPSVNNRDGSVRWRPLVWLNVLCLDAPLVALSWQWIFARELSIPLTTGDRAALFLTAWLIYLADRIADSFSLGTSSARSLRQEFCLRHRKALLAVCAAISLLDVIIAIYFLERAIFARGIFLGGVALVYLGINYAFVALWRIVPIKEIAIGFLFAAGTLLVLGPSLWSARSIIVPAVLFGALCSLNCMSIAIWERDLDCAQGKHSIATLWPRAGLSLQTALVLLAAICLGMMIADPTMRSLDLCLGLSAILLLILYFAKISCDERTALADLVLLTPLVVFVAGKIL